MSDVDTSQNPYKKDFFRDPSKLYLYIRLNEEKPNLLGAKLTPNVDNAPVTLLPAEPEGTHPLEETLATIPLRQRPWVTIGVTPTQTDKPITKDYAIDLANLNAVVPSERELLELAIVLKFKNLPKIISVYINQREDFISIKVLLNTKTYDYELMDNIFRKVEFPLQDMFEDLLIDFNYIPSPNGEGEELINKQKDKQIYQK